MKRKIRAKEMAELLGVSVRTLRNWTSMRHIPLATSLQTVTHWLAGRKTPTLEQGLAILGS
jgi:DNA-binding transcriptional regulator YiaG